MAAVNDIVNSRSVKVNLRVPHDLINMFPAEENNTEYLLRCVAEEQARAKRALEETRGHKVKKATDGIKRRGPRSKAEIEPVAKRERLDAGITRRPRKPKVDVLPEREPEPVLEAPKRKPGRPPKAKVTVAPEPAPVAPKRGPGRPPKAKVEVAPAPAPVPEQPVRVSRWKQPEKRKPGRPRKVDVEAVAPVPEPARMTPLEKRKAQKAKEGKAA